MKTRHELDEKLAGHRVRKGVDDRYYVESVEGELIKRRLATKSPARAWERCDMLRQAYMQGFRDGVST